MENVMRLWKDVKENPLETTPSPRESSFAYTKLKIMPRLMLNGARLHILQHYLFSFQKRLASVTCNNGDKKRSTEGFFFCI